jgi:hypothetical protein
MSDYIEIIDDGDTFTWAVPGYQKARMTLRKVSNADRDRVQEQHTRVKFDRGVRRDVQDTAAIGKAWLDLAIVDWDGFLIRTNGQRVPLECTVETKSKLPEALKADVIRMCLGGEAPEVDEGPLVPISSGSTPSEN